MHLRYLKIFFLITFLWIVLIAVVNIVVDPAAIFQIVHKEGFNNIKPKLGKYRFIWKTNYLEKNKPKMVFLGNSRVETGIDPVSVYRQGLVAKDVSVFNSAIPASTVYGIKRFAQQAILAGDVKELLIGVDYFQFRDSATQGAEKLYVDQEAVFSVDAQGLAQPLNTLVVYSKTVFSIDAFSASMQTLKKQQEKYSNLTALGHDANEKMVQNIIASGSQRHYFLKEEANFIDDYLKAKNDALHFERGIAEFREILLLARQHHVKVTLFINPTHVHLQYLDAHLGDTAFYYNWKRALTTMVSEINQEVGPPFVLWDFSIPVPETEEQLSEEKGIMQWYLDPSHFRRELGDKMLLRMLGSSSGAEAEFGMRLTPETIESAIDQHKQHLLLWQAEQPDDFAAFQQRIETRRKLFGVKAQGK